MEPVGHSTSPTEPDATVADFGNTFISKEGVSKVIVNSALFFVLDAFKSGVPNDEIVDVGANSVDLDDLISMKSLVWKLTACKTRPVDRRGRSANVSTMSDVMQRIAEMDSAGFEWPIVVPRNVREVPMLKSDSSVRLDRLVSNCDQKLVNTVKALSRIEMLLADKSVNPIPNVREWPTLPVSSEKFSTIKVSTVPDSWSDPMKRKAELDKLGASSVCEIRRTQDSVLVKLKASSSESFTNRLKQKFPQCEVSSSNNHYTAILRGLENEFDVKSLDQAITGISEFKRLGNSHTIKVFFDSEDFLKYYLVHGLNIGYEHFKLTPDRKLPKRCFRCQSLRHTSSKCDAPKLCCARCSGDHTHDKDHPCSLPVNCAHCSSCEHPSYSYRCPVLRKLIK